VFSNDENSRTTIPFFALLFSCFIDFYSVLSLCSLCALW